MPRSCRKTRSLRGGVARPRLEMPSLELKWSLPDLGLGLGFEDWRCLERKT